MKILQQKTLYLSEGKSDKIYEVDLCESGQDLYIVNFRYGRRGANLREGTKTVFPVPYEEALKVFNTLILSKEKKGYTENVTVKQQEPEAVSTETNANIAREETILKYLKDAATGVYTRDWKVSRILWRASHLKIIKAIPLIKQFVTSKDDFEQYAAIYALLKFNEGSEKEKIYNVFNTLGFKDKLGRIAAAYILKFGNATEQMKIRNAASNALPEELQNLTNTEQDYFNALAVYFLKDEAIDASVLYYTYIFSQNNETFRHRLYAFIEKTPLKVNTFKSIRYIYRITNLMEDLRFFALVSKRIAISNPGYSFNFLHRDDKWTSVYDEKKKANPSIAFSKKTKDYFNKTTYKHVYELSQYNTVNYITFATALLISLDDALDNRKEDIQYYYNYNSETRSYETEKRCFPKYHDFLALMYIVYGNSEKLQNRNGKWFYIETNTKTDNTPREEVLKELWDASPDAVLSILSNGRSAIAINFALRILKENTHFLDAIDIDTLGQLLGHYHPKVLDLILSTVEAKYATTQLEDTIVLALLKSHNEKANALGLKWLTAYEADYFSESDFIAALLLTGKAKVIQFLEGIYADTVKYNKPLDIETLEPLFTTPSTFTFEYLVLVNSLIGDTYFGQLLRTVPEGKIRELARSTTSHKLFAANLAKYNATPVYELFKDKIDVYINSEVAELRKVGIELLSHFPEDFLLENHKQISTFCFSEYDEVRVAIQPTVEKLIQLDSNFKSNLFQALLSAIENAETYDGLHKNCYALLTNNYKSYLESCTQEHIFGLLVSKYEYAQKLGLPLFEEKIDLKALSVKTIVQLAHSDVYAVRDALKQYFEDAVHAINVALEDALLIFNSTWEDIITWGCAYFEKYIRPEYWTVDMLLYACDHTKVEVQHFGRKMITQHFSEDKGLPLLLKLQEHPTKTMQFFVTNYLDNYAKGNVAVILKLEQFFKTSLFNINTDRVTKTRIYRFLEVEAVKDKTVAEMTVRLINSILGTNTLIDTSNVIDILLTVTETFPEIDVPLVIKQN